MSVVSSTSKNNLTRFEHLLVITLEAKLWVDQPHSYSAKLKKCTPDTKHVLVDLLHLGLGGKLDMAVKSVKCVWHCLDRDCHQREKVEWRGVKSVILSCLHKFASHYGFGSLPIDLHFTQHRMLTGD